MVLWRSLLYPKVLRHTEELLQIHITKQYVLCVQPYSAHVQHRTLSSIRLDAVEHTTFFSHGLRILEKKALI